MNQMFPAFALTVLLLLCACATPPQRSVTPISGTISFTGEYIKLVQADVKPQARSMKPPVYPRHWRERGIEGVAVIAFVVDSEGVPTQVHCRSATDQTFADAAQEAVRQWRFSPAYKNGRIMACAMEVPVRFTITGG